MNVSAHPQGLSLTPAIDSHVKRRIADALWLYESRIRRIDIYLRKVAGTLRGGSMTAKVRLQLHGRRTVTVRAVDNDLHRAVTRAARRAHKATKRAIRRQTRIERRRHHMPQAAITAPNIGVTGLNRHFSG